jgi:PAS domain S-box-containing protein
MKKSSTPSYTFPFILLGFLFGLLIVFFGTVVAVLSAGLPLTFDNLVQAQISTPLLWVLDSVPFFMAAILGILGSRETKLVRARRDTWDAQRRVTDASRLSSEMAKKDRERQDIEEVISRGKREWEATFDSVQDLILLTDERRTVIRCNRSAAQAFYLDFPQIIGKPVDELFFGSESGEQLPAQKTEVKFPALDGWYEVTSTPLTFEGIPHGKIFVVRNITDRKQAALDLERQKQFYEALVKNSPIAIVTLSLEHRVVACNPAFEVMFDYRQQEVLGQNIDSLISPLEILEESQSLTQRVERGETVYKISQRRRKDGTLIDVEAFGIPVVLWGKQIGILGMYNDITDLVRAGQVSRMEMLEEEVPAEAMEEEPEPGPESGSEPGSEEVPFEAVPLVVMPVELEEEPEVEEPVDEPVEEVLASPGRQRLIKIETIEGVGAVYAAKLAEVGIVTTEDLLNSAGTRKGRQDLAEMTGISSKLVLKWVNRADLMRVPGIGEEYSDLLEAGGVDTVKELRNRKAENLYKTLSQVNDEKSLVRRPPYLSEVEAWIAAAKEIEPRVSY